MARRDPKDLVGPPAAPLWAKPLYSDATVTSTSCVLDQEGTSYCGVLVIIHTSLRKMYVGIKMCQSKLMYVLDTVMYQLAKVLVTVAPLYIHLKILMLFSSF